jgi:hypothetical protein
VWITPQRIDRETGLPELIEALESLRMMSQAMGYDDMAQIAIDALRKAGES